MPRNIWEQNKEQKEFVPNVEQITEMLDSRLDFLKAKITGVEEREAKKEVSFNCKYNIEDDLNTYVMTTLENTVNSLGIPAHRERVLNRIDPEMRQIIEENTENKDVCIAKMRELLTRRYDTSIDIVTEYEQATMEAFNRTSPAIIRNLQTLYGYDFMFDKVDIYISTSGTCPYDARNGKFAISAHNKLQTDFINPVSTGVHEMNHFMFEHSKYPDLLKEKLNADEFYLLRESLTYFTDPERPDLRPAEVDLKALYESRTWESLDEVVEAATAFLINQREKH